MTIPREIEFFDGWGRGRALCLSMGPDAARQWLKEHACEPETYRQGAAQGLRDYLDANRLPLGDPLDSVS